MFRKWLCLSPVGAGGEGGGAGAGTAERAGDRIRASIKDADSPERLLRSITESLGDLADDLEDRQRVHKEEMGNEMRGARAKMDEVSALIGKMDGERVKAKLRGRVMPGFEPLSKNPQVDEVLRMYAASDEVVAFQESCDDYQVVNMLARAARQYGSQAGWVQPGHHSSLNESLRNAEAAMFQRADELGIPGLRATGMDTGTATSGAEWIPTGFSADVWTKYLLAQRVGSIFETFTIPQRVGSYDWPVQNEDPTAYIAGQATDFTWTPTMTGSAAITAKRTFSPKVFAVRVHLSREFEEDAVFAVAPWIRGRMGVALAVGRERALISGDASTTHMDADVCATTATDVRTAFDGLRRMAKGNTARINSIGAALTATNIAKLGAKMGVWSAQVEDNVLIAGTNGAWQLLDMTGVKTITDYGALATSVRGEIAQYIGRPIIVTGYMPDTTGGVVDTTAGNNIFTQILMVNRRPILIGEKRGATMDTWFNPFTQQLGIVATVRFDTKCLPLYTATGNTVVGDLYNLTLW